MADPFKRRGRQIGCRPRPWTEAEVEELRRLRAEGLIFEEIGEAIGRPKGSCVSKAIALNLPTPKIQDQNHEGLELRNRAESAMQLGAP